MNYHKSTPIDWFLAGLIVLALFILGLLESGL